MPKPRGATHHNAKLTDAQVSEIRVRRARGEKLISIALDYGITESHVSRVFRNINRKES